MGPPLNRGEEWFAAAYAAHYPQIVKYGLRRLGDTEGGVELAQDVFVIAWRRRADVPDYSLPWLYGVARRLLANRWRARRGRPEVVPVADPDRLRGCPDPNPTGEDGAVELAGLRVALATLSAIDQEILRLIGWEELTVAEAATVLGCTRTAATVRLHRARRRLAAAMTTPTSALTTRPAAARS